MKKDAPAYLPHTEEEIKKMLDCLRVGSLEELLFMLPPDARLKTPLRLPQGLSEQEVRELLTVISKKNSPVSEFASFLGAGSYNHYIPSAVGQIILRSEFYTSYTPYQPEISQGTLQAIFEYQTLICQLTGMEVSNASLYDGACATAEAALMARRITGRKKVLISASVHPEYRDTVNTYLKGNEGRAEEVFYCTEKGITLPEAVEEKLNADTACLIIQNPNFFGSIEDIKTLSELIHKKGGLLIAVVTEPLSLGLFKSPGELSADIVVGEGQSFGNPMNYGGPYLGFMATKMDYVRQMPGRVVGQTVDKNNKRSFCLTFSTREQHIRREKATSNICTNEGLSALACAIYLSLVGKNGLKKLATLNLSKAKYLENKISAVKGVKKAFSTPFFNEFVIEIYGDAEEFLKKLLKKRILGGVSLKRFYPELNRHILITATEMNSKESIDRYSELAAEILGKG